MADSPIAEKVYCEAGQWLRTTNAVIWSMGTLFVPLSLTPLWAAVTTAANRCILACASIFLFLFWVFVSNLYLKSAAAARRALMAVERSLEIPEEQAFYTAHGQIGLRSYGLRTVQIISVLLLIAVWVIVIFYVSPIPAKGQTKHCGKSLALLVSGRQDSGLRLYFNLGATSRPSAPRQSSHLPTTG